MGSEGEFCCGTPCLREIRALVQALFCSEVRAVVQALFCSEVRAVLCRPFAPWEGCCVCWEDEDRKHILLCDECDAEYHTYCLDPPLQEVPEGVLLSSLLCMLRCAVT